jgi:hypothetical protein
MRYVYKYIVLLLITPNNLLCQKIDNIRIEQVNDQIHIYYDLSEVDENEILKIEIYLSDDAGLTYSIIPKSVIGDVGLGISAGKNKKIIWYPLNDVNELIGENYKFKISATYLKANYKSSVRRSRYLGTYIGYGRYDNVNNLLFGLEGVIYFGRIGLGLSVNGFISNAEYEQWDTRSVYCYYGGILAEPIIIKSRHLDIYTPVFIGFGQIIEQFKDPEYSETPKNTLMIGFIEPGIGFDFNISRKIKLAFEAKYLISNKTEFYNVSGTPRRYKGLSADIVLKIGYFNN